MDNLNSFINSIQSIAKTTIPNQTDVVVGTVLSAKPLKVEVEKNLQLEEDFLVLGALCKETIIKIPKRDNYKHHHTVPQNQTGLPVEDGIPAHTHMVPEIDTTDELPDILLWRGLKTGDKVILIKFSQGQKYYVLQRLEGID